MQSEALRAQLVFQRMKTGVNRRRVRTPIGVANLLILLRTAGANLDAYSQLVIVAGHKLCDFYANGTNKSDRLNRLNWSVET